MKHTTFGNLPTRAARFNGILSFDLANAGRGK